MTFEYWKKQEIYIKEKLNILKNYKTDNNNCLYDLYEQELEFIEKILPESLLALDDEQYQTHLDSSIFFDIKNKIIILENELEENGLKLSEMLNSLDLKFCSNEQYQMIDVLNHHISLLRLEHIEYPEWIHFKKKDILTKIPKIKKGLKK